MGMWEALQYVGTGLSLVAFAVAAILLAYRARLTQRAEIIKSASEQERLEAIATTAEFFRVDVSGLTRAQQQDIALTQIHARARRDLLLAGVSLVVAILLAAIAMTAIWVSKPAGPATVVNPSGPVIAPGRDANFYGPVNLGGLSKEQFEELKAIVQNLNATRSGPATPNQDQAIAEAVAAAQRGAAAGDTTLQQALDLLKANNIAEAEAKFRAVADEKAARISQDKKDAAAAYRNLGAIAGLGDPKKALDAYEKALEFDPDDVESLFQVGFIQIDRGYLDEAQKRLDRVLSLATRNQPFYQYWARLGLGDIREQRGDLTAALAFYRDGLAIADRLAKSDPGDAGWQRDLSVSYNRVGDVQVGQGDLAGALKSATASPSETGWRNPIPVTPAGSAICRSRTIGSATCRSRRAILRAR
jgi:tetratricopeptide (TPR) repeat protein